MRAQILRLVERDPTLAALALAEEAALARGFDQSHRGGGGCGIGGGGVGEAGYQAAAPGGAPEIATETALGAEVPRAARLLPGQPRAAARTTPRAAAARLVEALARRIVAK